MKTRQLSILCFLLMSLGIQAHNLEPLHVDGRYLKNSKGDIVTLHGYMTTLDPGDEYRFAWDGYNVAMCLKNKKAALDAVLESGWKMDYVRFKLDSYWCCDQFMYNGEEYKYFEFERFKKYFEELFLPLLDYYHEKGIYTLLFPPHTTPDLIEVGDEFQQHLMLLWNYVSSHPRIKNNPGVMFELANEPVGIKCHQGDSYDPYWGFVFNNTSAFREFRDYWQPIVDEIRSHCDNIVYIPGLQYESDHAGFADYPIEGNNIGYAVHWYPGWWGNMRKDWEGHVFPIAYKAPIIITENAWVPNNNYLDGNSETSTSNFGKPLKDIVDELGNVSWNCYEPDEDYYFFDSSSSSEKAVISNNPEACFKAMYQWWDDYSKTKVIPTNQLKAKAVSFDEFPTAFVPGQKSLAQIKAEFTNGMTWDVSGDVEYTIADESVLSIKHGVIGALKEGSTTVTAKYTDGTGQTFSHEFEIINTLFPLTNDYFVFDWYASIAGGSFDEATNTFSCESVGSGGWHFDDGIDLSSYKYLVVQLNQEQHCKANLQIWDNENDSEESLAWNDETKEFGFDFNDATELVIDLHSLQKQNGDPLALSHIYYVYIRIIGELGSVSIKRVFLSNDGITTAYQEPTCVYADHKAICYGDDVPTLTYTVSGPRINGTPTLSTTANSTSSAGTYPITIGRGSVTDEQVSFIDGELTIFKAPLTVGVQDVTINEGDTPIPTFTYSGFLDGDGEGDVLKSPVLSASLPKILEATKYISNLPAGSYVIMGKDGEAVNYELCSGEATLTIKEFPFEGTDMTNRIGMFPNDWHVNDVAYYSSPVKTSDGREEALVQTFEETVENVGEQMWQEIRDLPNGDYVVEVYANAVYTPDRGFESSVIEGAEDVAYVEANGQRTYLHTRINGEILPWSDFYRIYTSVTDGTLRIALVVEKPGTNWHTIQMKRLVKLPDYNITANNITMVYGDEIPELTYTTEGWKPEGKPKLTTTATKNSPVGTYPIKIEKGTVTNEKVAYVEGTLTITQAPLTVGVQDVTITEGNAIPSFTLTYSGFKNGDTESNAFTTKPTATTMATSSSTSGTYPITVSGGTATNYAPTYMQGTLTIKEKPVEPATVTANDQTMVYGDDVPTLTYKSSGAKLNGTPKLSTTATKNSPVGTYPIKVEKGTVTNEKVSFVDGTLTIIQAPLTVGVVDVTITEGDAIPSFTLNYSGFRNNDYANRAFTKKPTATTTATSNSAPGTYPIIISGGEAKNYELTYKPGTLTIEPAAGIESVYADGQGNAVIYNVNGQKLSKPRKGINIIGGKKVVVK